MVPALRYADDLTVGTDIALGTVHVTEDEIIRFAMEFDPLPIHVDIDYATLGPFGGVIASGIHTLGLYQRLQSAWLRTVAVVAGLGCDRMRLPTPERPGDELTARTAITAMREQSAHRALMQIHSTMHSEAGVVLDLHASIVVQRRG